MGWCTTLPIDISRSMHYLLHISAENDEYIVYLLTLQLGLFPLSIGYLIATGHRAYIANATGLVHVPCFNIQMFF